MEPSRFAALAVFIIAAGGPVAGRASAADWSAPRVVDSAEGSPWRFSLGGEVLFTGDNEVPHSIGRHDSTFEAPVRVLSRERSELLLGLNPHS